MAKAPVKDQAGSAPKFMYGTEETWYDGATDPLTVLLRKVLLDRNITRPHQWIEMSNNFYRDCYPDMPRGKITSDRSNLADAMSNGTISYKKFMEAIRIIAHSLENQPNIVISVRFETDNPNDVVEEHSMKIRTQKPRKRREI